MFIEKGVKGVGIIRGDNFRKDRLMRSEGIRQWRAGEVRGQEVGIGRFSSVESTWKDHSGKSKRRRGGKPRCRRNRCGLILGHDCCNLRNWGL